MPLYSPTSSSQGLITLLDRANAAKGSTVNCTTYNTAVHAVGATTINTLGSGTILAGDVITFGTVNNVQDDPQGSATTQTIQQNRYGGNHALTRYKVTTGSNDVNAGTIVISPGLEIAIPKLATITVVTDVNLNASSGAATHANTQLWVNRELFLYHTLQVINASGATVKLYESLNAANWVEVTTTTPALGTSSGIFVLPSRAYGYLKLLRDTATTTGTVTAILLSQHATGNR